MMYIFLSFLVFNVIVFFSLKRLVPIEIYATYVFAYAYGVTTRVLKMIAFPGYAGFYT